MNTRRLLLLLLVSLLVVTAAFAQFTPRKDYVWARNVLGAQITLDGILNESVWAQAESVVVQYGTSDGMPGSGWKIMNGSGVPGDPANAVIKFLADKVTNTLYVAVTSHDSSIGGGGWENSDGILGGFYNLNQRASVNGLPLQQDIFITWIDSTGVGTLPNLFGGYLPSHNYLTAAAHVNGISNSDTNGSGQIVADQGWTIEMAVNLDSLGYDANTSTTEAVMMTMAIWDADWIPLAGHIATKAWWMHEWGNDGGVATGRVLIRNDVNVNTATLPAYPPDLVIPNGANYTDPVVDGDLSDSIWAHVPELDLQFGNSALRAAYTNIGPNKSGQYVPLLSGSLNSPIDPGMARVKMFFKGDKLYVGADIDDQSLWHYIGDDFFDGLQVSLNLPVDTLRDATHQMASRRYGFAIDSVSKGGKSALWDAVQPVDSGWIQYGIHLKPGSTIDNPNDIDAGFTIEAVFDLTKFGYTAGAPNKMLGLGLNYHDYDLTPTDTSSYRVWWYREWPWASTPAFALLDDATLVTGVRGNPGPTTAQAFKLIGNYPNPFNPSTKIRYSLPSAGTATVRIYDVLGQQVDAMQLNATAGGIHEQVFNASRLASGVYFYRVEFTSGKNAATRISETQKMVLLK